MDIKVGTAEYDEVRDLAWIAIVAYPIGLLALVGALLFASRRAILTKRPTVLSRSIAFLYNEYEEEYFFWERAV